MGHRRVRVDVLGYWKKVVDKIRSEVSAVAGEMK